MQNLASAATNLSLALLVLAVLAAGAAAIRPLVADRDDPLGAPIALAVSAGGFGLTILLFLALGLIGGDKDWDYAWAWWLPPVLVWLALVTSIAWAKWRATPAQGLSHSAAGNLPAVLAVAAAGAALLIPLVGMIIGNPGVMLIPVLVGLLIVVVETVAIARTGWFRTDSVRKLFSVVSPGALATALLALGAIVITLFPLVLLGCLERLHRWLSHYGLPTEAPFILAIVSIGVILGIVCGWLFQSIAESKRSLGCSYGRLLPASAFLAWMIAFDLLQCFQPRFQSDALWYHLTLPVYWCEQGGMGSHPTLAVAGYPLLTEMLYTVPVSHGLPFAARVIHLAFGIGVVLVIWGYLRRGLSAAGALAFAAAFFVFDSVNEVAAWANTDLARTFFLVGGAACLATYVDGGKRRDLIVGAVLAGLAMSTHYMAIVFGAGLMTIGLAIGGPHRTRRRAETNEDPDRLGNPSYFISVRGVSLRRFLSKWFRDVGLFLAVAAAVFSPWPFKNLVHYGNPFYGLAGSNFRIPPAAVLSDFLLGNVFFVGFAGLALWRLLRPAGPRGERFLALYLLTYLVVGPFLLPPILRFFFPVYAIGLMLAGRAAAPLLERRRWLEIAIPLAMLAVAVLMVGYQWRQHLFDDAIDFLWRNQVPERRIEWHH